MTKIELPKDGMPRIIWIFYIVTDKDKVRIIDWVSTYDEYRKLRQYYNNMTTYNHEVIKKRFIAKIDITEVEH